MSFFAPSKWQGDAREQRRIPRIPECGRCGLFRNCNTPKMPPGGDGERRILIVGESPSQSEDDRGRHFSGKSGQLLRKVLRRHRVELSDCHLTNAAICHPEGGLHNLHIESCRPNLLKTIKQTKPRVIILLGAAAVRGLVPAERAADVGSINRWVGWHIPSADHKAWICPTYHPSFIMGRKDFALRKFFSAHLKAAVRLEKKKIQSPTIEHLISQVECITNPRLAYLRLKGLWKKRKTGGVLAVDYECNRLKPDYDKSRIFSTSFCLDGKDTFAILNDDRCNRLISKILRYGTFHCIASNIKMEERWTKAIMGHPVASWYWDTMLATHILDNRGGISSLKFQSYVQFGIADYESKTSDLLRTSDEEGYNRIHEIPVDELLLYNGLDSLLEYMLAMKQRRQMGIK